MIVLVSVIKNEIKRYLYGAKNITNNNYFLLPNYITIPPVDKLILIYYKTNNKVSKYRQNLYCFMLILIKKKVN